MNFSFRLFLLNLVPLNAQMLKLLLVLVGIIGRALSGVYLEQLSREPVIEYR